MVDLKEPHEFGFGSIENQGGSSSNREGTPRERNQEPFALIGDAIFAPFFFPERIQVTKQRNISREQNFCKGEDVHDQGPKNRDVHVNGRLVGGELNAFDAVLDAGGTFTMTSTTWSGEVVIEQGDYEGPVGWHPPSGDLHWEYTLDLISTGLDEEDEEQVDLFDTDRSLQDELNPLDLSPP